MKVASQKSCREKMCVEGGRGQLWFLVSPFSGNGQSSHQPTFPMGRRRERGKERREEEERKDIKLLESLRGGKKWELCPTSFFLSSSSATQEKADAGINSIIFFWACLCL